MQMQTGPVTAPFLINMFNNSATATWVAERPRQQRRSTRLTSEPELAVASRQPPVEAACPPDIEHEDARPFQASAAPAWMLRSRCLGRSYPIRSSPPIYGRSTSGTSIEPSAFW